MVIWRIIARGWHDFLVNLVERPCGPDGFPRSHFCQLNYYFLRR